MVKNLNQHLEEAGSRPPNPFRKDKLLPKSVKIDQKVLMGIVKIMGIKREREIYMLKNLNQHLEEAGSRPPNPFRKDKFLPESVKIDQKVSLCYGEHHTILLQNKKQFLRPQ